MNHQTSIQIFTSTTSDEYRVEDGGIDKTDGEIGEGTNEHMVQETMKTQIFHVANIQNLLTKTETGERGMFVRKIEKNGHHEGLVWGGGTTFPSLL